MSNPAPSRAPTTALPPEVTALIDELETASRIAALTEREHERDYCTREEWQECEQAVVAAREALDAALLQFVEDGRRLDYLHAQRDPIHSRPYTFTMHLTAFQSIRAYLDRQIEYDAQDAARSVVSAPVGEAEQP